MCEVVKRIAKELAVLVFVLLDEAKFHIGAVLSLARSHLISVVDVFKYTTSKITLPQARTNPITPSLIDFSIKILAKFVTDNALFVPDLSLTETAELLHRALTQMRNPRADDLARVIEELRAKSQASQPKLALPLSLNKETEARNSMNAILEEWVKLSSDPVLNSEKARLKFVTQIQGQGIISSDEISSLFFRTGVEKRLDLALFLFSYFLLILITLLVNSALQLD